MRQSKGEVSTTVSTELPMDLVCKGEKVGREGGGELDDSSLLEIGHVWDQTVNHDFLKCLEVGFAHHSVNLCFSRKSCV